MAVTWALRRVENWVPKLEVMSEQMMDKTTVH